MRRCDRKKEYANASHGAPTPPPATAAAKKAATAAKPAPPAAQKITCAANAHLYLPSKTSHTDCAACCAANSAANTKTRPFPKNCALIFKKNRNKTSPYLILSRQVASISCHEEQKILAKISTPFDLLCRPSDTLSIPFLSAHSRLRWRRPQAGPGHSWAKPVPPSTRAAALPARRSSPSSTTVSPR